MLPYFQYPQFGQTSDYGFYILGNLQFLQ